MFSLCQRGAAGSVLIMTLVFVGMFVIVFLALSGLVGQSYHQSVLQSHDELAFQIAEAGLNYGRWRLAHASSDFSAEAKPVTDQLAGVLGDYSLTFTQPLAGSTVVIITSVGKTTAQPQRIVTLQARYGIPSLARYSYIINNDVYFAAEMHGIAHANGGIRMDGQSDSVVQSAKETYTCQPLHGCNPPQTKPGVWGTGQLQSLWRFPVAPVDYAALSLDLAEMKTAAQGLGTYYAPSGVFGYELVFNPDTTYTIYRVTQKAPNVYSCEYNSNNNWQCGNFSHDIQTRVLVETKTVPNGGVIFVEDHVWVSGNIRNRVTVAAGRFPDNPATNVDIITNGSISYGGVTDGTRSFGAIAQRHILIPWSGAADTLKLDGAFLAQKGKFGRRYYNCCGAQAHRLKTRVDVFGMIGSNLIPGTTWSSGGVVVSGYRQKTQTYDPNLLYGPPPYFPSSGQYEFISWEQL